MPDFRSLVRSMIDDADVVDELTQHAETAFKAARTEGVSEEEAFEAVRSLIRVWCSDPSVARRQPQRFRVIDPPASADARALAGLLQDVRYAVRLLRRQPGFAITAIVTLAVGLGATTAIFSTVNAALLRPLPFPHPENLYAVFTPATDGRFTLGSVSGVELARLNTPTVSVVRAAGCARIDTTLARDDGTALSVVAYGVTEGFFEVFGLPMLVGRSFSPGEHAPGAPWVAVLSYRLWRDRFGSDPGIVGRPIRLTNGPPSATTVIGIAPPTFDMPHLADVWVPLPITPQSTGHGFDGYLRIKDGTRLERLHDELAAAMASIARDYGSLGKNRRYDLQPLATAIVGDLRPTLLIVLIAAVLLLLLACVNVTNLMLARGTVRSREMAVRVALGAGRSRLVKQLLTESLVLSTAGTLAGGLIALVGVRLLLTLGAASMPRLDAVPLDARVVGFSLVALIVTALVVGFAPSWRLMRASLNALMKEGSRHSTVGGAAGRALEALVIVEIAIAITLVAGAGWMIRSFANLGAVDPGFDAERRLIFDVSLPPARILPPPGTDPITLPLVSSRLMSWTREFEDHLGAIPGVTSAATAASMPLEANHDSVLYIGVQGDVVDPEHPRVARAHSVSPAFFETMGIKLIAGRSFTADDRVDTVRVAVVNRTFARRYLGDRDPLTVKFTAGYPDVPASPVTTVVGMVDDVRYVSLSQPADPAYYTPEAQAPFFVQTFVLRTAVADPMRLAESVRSVVHQLDPLLPVTPRSLTELVAMSLVRQRLGMVLMLIFGLTALGLAAVGVYGVLAYVSAQRHTEVATRLALGATPADVFRLMMRQGLLLTLIGTVGGLLLSLGAGRAASALLYQVRVFDPLILGLATVLVVAITVASVAIPARRAAHVEAAQLLRLE